MRISKQGEFHMYQKIYLNDWLTGLKSSCCTLIVTLLVFI
ncbi:hypothetical protein [Citrobacter braakii]